MKPAAAPGFFDLNRESSFAAALSIALLIYFIAFVTRFHVSAIWPLAPFGDASILYEVPRFIVERGDYPGRLALGTMNAVFPYPPSAVLLLHGLGAAGPGTFMAAWLVLMAAGLWTTLRGSLGGERPGIQAYWLAIAAIALLVAGGPVEWDLRNANSNLVALGLVMAGYAVAERRPAMSGVLIGISVSLKLYSGLLLPWLLLKGPRPAFFSAALTCIFLWLLLPLAVFGPAGTVHVYIGWIEQLRIISDPWIYSWLALGQTAAPIATLRRAVMTILGVGPEASSARLMLGAAWCIWTGVLVAYAARALTAGAMAVPSRAALADWTVLLLALLPFSPWLEPYHAIPLVVGAILLLATVIDDSVAPTDRAIALTAIVGLAMIRLAHLPLTVRGLDLLASFLVVVGALSALRPRLALTTLAGSGSKQ